MRCSVFYKNKNRGFTLTELIVVMTIATIMMTTLVIKQSTWNDQLVVSTQAYELALMIRQAQIYSLGVKENNLGTGDKFNAGYGVFFGRLASEDSSSLAWKKRYIFFADINNDKIYNEGIDNIIETKTLNRDVEIDRFCGIKGINSDRCSPGTGNVSYLYITFFRPELKASIIMRNSGGGPVTNVDPPAKIFFKSPQNKYFYVKVEESGQISAGEGNSI